MSSPEPPAPAVRATRPSADDIAALVGELRATFEAGTTRPVAARLSQLKALSAGLRAHRGALLEALDTDLGKSAAEAQLTELGVVQQEIGHHRRKLRSWLRPERFSPGVMLAPSRGEIHREPLGVTLVISPWNYPLNLALAPVVAAIAGGNTVVLKPSEVAPATSAAIASLVAEHLDPAWVRVVEGGVEETTALLAQRFDLIFYTGNATVGRIVARAAAEHLTPTVLELGGKSPVFVDEGADLEVAARGIVWGKFTNAGQTCVAPDYLMATPRTLSRLLPLLRREIRRMYGADPSRSRDYGRIVAARHFDRVAGLIDEEKVLLGGLETADRGARYLPPTLMTGVGWEDAVMQEEIFGPVLPLLEVAGPAEAVERVRAGEKPLTAYVYTRRTEVEEAFTELTSSGSLAINLTLAHVGSPTMPFGGVGESGMGQYHGRAGLEAFTHAKPVIRKPLRPDTLRVAHPPLRGLRAALLRRMMR